MSVSQSKTPQCEYVQSESWVDLFQRGAGYEGYAQEEYDRQRAGAQEIDDCITTTGKTLAQILGVSRIVEKREAASWLRANTMQEACAKAIGGSCSSGFMEHPRRLYVNGRLVGDLFSPYTSRVGVGWGEAADVQHIADAMQHALEEHNYGVASTCLLYTSPSPRDS